MIYLLILAILIIISLCFVAHNLYTQSNELEEFIIGVEKREKEINEDAEKYYTAFLHLFANAQSELVRIDRRGTFSSDDEVGFAFKVIKTSIDNVVLKLKQFKEDDKD